MHGKNGKTVTFNSLRAKRKLEGQWIAAQL